MSEPKITIDVDWQIATMGREILNNPSTPGLNDFGRFDPASQDDTLGPYPPSDDVSQDNQTNGEPGTPPVAK